MKDMMKLYKQIKNKEGVDSTIIEGYIKIVLKDTKCSSIEELHKKIEDKQVELNNLNNQNEITKERIANINAKIKNLYFDQEVERKNVLKKGIIVSIAYLIVVGITLGILIPFFNVSAILLVIAILLAESIISFNLFKELSANYHQIQKEMDELYLQENTLNKESNKYFLESLSLYNSINDLKDVRDNIVDFMENYILDNNSSQEKFEEIKYQEEENKETPKSLHRI